MNRTLVAAALTIALVSTHALAECKADEFQRYVNAAVRLYESLEYERALDQLSRAHDVSCGTDNDATLGMYEGAIRSDLGQAEQSRAAFKEALLLKPEAEIGLKISPKVKRLIETVRAEANRELAPLLARQADERRKREAAEAAKKAEETRRAEQTSAEQARRAAAQAKVIVVETNPADAPVNRELTANPSRSGDDVLSPVDVEGKADRRDTPVVAIVFASAGVVAGGVGAAFGVAARQTGSAAASATFQSDRQRLINTANTQALTADVLFGVAGALAVGALIAWFTAPPEPTVERAK